MNEEEVNKLNKIKLKFKDYLNVIYSTVTLLTFLFSIKIYLSILFLFDVF
jgi:hypothetical protein